MSASGARPLRRAAGAEELLDQVELLRFANVPDAPPSKFELKLKGGRRSLIQNSANLCTARPSVEVKMTGKNGKTNGFRQKIAVSCGKKKG